MTTEIEEITAKIKELSQEVTRLSKQLEAFSHSIITSKDLKEILRDNQLHTEQIVLKTQEHYEKLFGIKQGGVHKTGLTEMELKESISKVSFSETQKKILNLLFEDPNKRTANKILAQKLDLSEGSISASIKNINQKVPTLVNNPRHKISFEEGKYEPLAINPAVVKNSALVSLLTEKLKLDSE